MWFVYILLCDQKTFYTGITDNLKLRIIQHQSKQSLFTKKFSEIKLTYCEKYSNKQLADSSQIERSYMGTIERGKRNPTLMKVYNIAKALKISAGQLLPF